MMKRIQNGIRSMVTVLVTCIALVINQAEKGITTAVTVLVDRITLTKNYVKAHTKESIMFGIKWFLAAVIMVVFVFASISYDEEQYWKAIVSTGLVSALLLAVQTVGAATWKLRTWNLWTIQTIIVGACDALLCASHWRFVWKRICTRNQHCR